MYKLDKHSNRCYVEPLCLSKGMHKLCLIFIGLARFEIIHTAYQKMDSILRLVRKIDDKYGTGVEQKERKITKVTLSIDFSYFHI